MVHRVTGELVLASSNDLADKFDPVDDPASVRASWVPR
jgi:hypothetical protein